MKKIILLLGFVLLSSGACQAAVFGNFQCGANPNINSISISNLIGTNFLGEKIANAIIRKEILKDSKGKYSVDLQSYNLTDLKKGIFKSLEINGTDTVTDGIHASKVKFKTLCDYNYIEINNKEKTTTFKEPFGMAYAIQFTDEDLNKTMESKKYAELIRKVNGIGNTYKLFNISSTSAKILENKLYYTMNVQVPLINLKQEITLETDVKARSGEILLSDTKLVTESFKFDISKLDKIINYLNPLEFSMNIFKNKDAQMHIQDATISNNIINVNGVVTVDKDVVTE